MKAAELSERRGWEDSISPLVRALDQTNPAIAIELNSEELYSDSSGTLPTEYSLIQLKPDDAEDTISKKLVLWAVKPAENSSGTDVVARWWNIGDHDRNVTLKCTGLQSI